TSKGTHNLNNGAKNCKGSEPKKVEQDDKTLPIAYTPAHHRALIALRCMVSKWPFSMVKDPLYLAEVELLRPGTVVPHPTTVSGDILKIYTESAKLVKSYFEV
ncbi:hypothetical protein BOTBODRAFT_80592, partial [Botryobasidium botryosum FD-172 SS1]